jgi:uncharacterized protein (DUF1499 family)
MMTPPNRTARLPRVRAAAALGWIGIAAAGASGLCALLAGPGYRLGAWPLGTGLQIIRGSATVALIATAAAIIALLLTPGNGVGRARWVALAALGLGLIVAAPPLYLYWQATHLPRIHDISTDTDDPPRFVAVLPLRGAAANPTDDRADLAARQKAAYPDIAPVFLEVPPAAALQLAERTARSMGWAIVAVAPEALRLEATATTRMFGFKDDVVVRIAAHDRGSRVDVRSVSRIGLSDLGTNAERIRAFARKLRSAARSG